MESGHSVTEGRGKQVPPDELFPVRGYGENGRPGQKGRWVGHWQPVPGGFFPGKATGKMRTKSKVGEARGGEGGGGHNEGIAQPQAMCAAKHISTSELYITRRVTTNHCLSSLTLTKNTIHQHDEVSSKPSTFKFLCQHNLFSNVRVCQYEVILFLNFEFRILN